MAAAFRLFSKMQNQFGMTGQLLSGGYFKFYIAHSTTPKDTYGEIGLTTNNGPIIALDSAGRPVDDIWGSGSYFVELYDSNDVKQSEADDVEIPGGDATAFPALVASEFLTNDGAVMSWAAILQVPDPTGHSGQSLTNNGTTILWQTLLASPSTLYQVVTAATTTTIDLSLGCAILLNQAVDITTLAFTNPPSATAAYIVSITRVKDATGTARAITNLSSIATFPGGVPTLTQTTGAIDVLSLKFEPSVAKARGSYILNLS
jgi:hypothetical protein